VSNKAKFLLVCGAILTMTGSFLPWQREGDFVSYLTYGIHISPFSFDDNGGLLIILLSVCVLICIFQPPKFIKKPLVWSIAFSFILVLLSAFQISKVLISRIQASGVIGAPMIEVGLIMVSLGSTLILWASWSHYKKAS